MSQQPPVGAILGEDATRDAIHIAIAPVIAGEELYPCQRIGFRTPGETTTVYAQATGPGIVDPYLNGLHPTIYPGERFWMFLQPATITTLRHEWTHPAFVGPAQVAASSAWIARFAADFHLSHEDLMQQVARYLLDGDRIILKDNIDNYEELDHFWTHYQNFIGCALDPDDIGTCPFTCSC